MSDSVKFIFKTLFKVPCYILVAYALLNAFAFTYTYFRALGFSYVVMQTAVENNYLPAQELGQLNAYLATLDNAMMVENAHLVLNEPTDSDYVAGIPVATTRRQYGAPVRVGVSLDYVFMWPLMPVEQTVDQQGVAGFDGTTSGMADGYTLQQRREAKNTRNNITISYTVPGLKYYPDLLNY